MATGVETRATRTTALPAARLLVHIARKPAVLLAVLVLLAYLVMALFPQALTDVSPRSQDLRGRFLPPAWYSDGDSAYLLGTDHLGRDVYTRIVYGARTSISVAVAVFLGAGLFGLVAGLLAGFYRGWVDDAVTFWINVQLAFPRLLLVIALLFFVRAGLGTVVLVLVATTWVMYARVVRGVVMSLRETPFVQASRALGARDVRLLIRQLLPNLMAPVLVIGTLQMAEVVILEATLSFLGLGVPPPAPTWGGMLSDGRRYMLNAPWLTTVPGLALMLLVLSINVLGDFLRDYLDPRLKS